MDYKSLRELVKQGEGNRLEFKLKTNHPEKIVREIVAFANTDGGKLLIGVSDDRTIKGLKYIDEDEYLLTRAIEKYCSEGIEYDLERVPIGDEREVLVLNIQRSKQRPQYVLQEIDISKTNDTFKHKKYTPPKNRSKLVRRTYIRVADKSVQASWEMREILRRRNEHTNIQFRYGEKEKKLMQHLDQHHSITVQDFAHIANIPRSVASKTLVVLVLANVLEVHPDEIEDKFSILHV